MPFAVCLRGTLVSKIQVENEAGPPSEIPHPSEKVMIYLLMALSVILSYYSEVYEWNEGVCRATGEPWELISKNWAGSVYLSGEKVIVVSWC